MLLCPWGFSRQEYWSGLPCPPPKDLPTKGSNPGLLYYKQILYHLSHQGSPRILEWLAYPFSSESSQPGIKQGSPALQVDSLPAELPGDPHRWYCPLPSCSVDTLDGRNEKKKESDRNWNLHLTHNNCWLCSGYGTVQIFTSSLANHHLFLQSNSLRTSV